MDLASVWCASASLLDPLPSPNRQVENHWVMWKLVVEGLTSPAERFEREWKISFLQYCNMSSSHRPVEGSGLVRGSTPRGGGLPKWISKGLMFTRDLFLILTCIRTIGRAFVHGSPVSSQHLASLDFRVPFSRSTAPPLAGWYAQCCLRPMPRNSLIRVIAKLKNVNHYHWLVLLVFPI